jgi:hypothetical protein
MTTISATPRLGEETLWLFEKVGFEPTPSQLSILTSRKRFILVAGGEQGGKSLTASKYALMRVPETEGPGLYWLVASDYDGTKREFEYLAEDFAKLGWLKSGSNGQSKRVDPGFLELVDGTRFETKSGKDASKLRMSAPNGIIACEAGVLDFDVYNRIMGRAAPSRAWVFMSGTYESSLGWYPSLAEEWTMGRGDRQSFELPSTSNFHLYPGGEKDPEILRLKEESSDAFFMERIMGKRVPPKGLVFPEFKVDIHVQNVEWVPGTPVEVWIDPGYSEPSAYALHAVQYIDGQIQVFHEIYERGKVSEDIIHMCRLYPWYDQIVGGAIDIAGTQHHGSSAAAEDWLQIGGIHLHSEKVPINQGIERLKTFLKTSSTDQVPGIVYSPKCRGILGEYGVIPDYFDGQSHGYRWRTDRDGNAYGETPLDARNHAIKADIYGLVSRFGYSRSQQNSVIKVKRWQ